MSDIVHTRSDSHTGVSINRVEEVSVEALGATVLLTITSGDTVIWTEFDLTEIDQLGQFLTLGQQYATASEVGVTAARAVLGLEEG